MFDFKDKFDLMIVLGGFGLILIFLINLIMLWTSGITNAFEDYRMIQTIIGLLFIIFLVGLMGKLFKSNEI